MFPTGLYSYHHLAHVLYLHHLLGYFVSPWMDPLLGYMNYFFYIVVFVSLKELQHASVPDWRSLKGSHTPQIIKTM